MTERIRVVVTGMGAVTPLGLDFPSSWEAIIAGESGIDYITAPPEFVAVNQIVGQVKNFDGRDYFNPKSLRRIHRSAQFAFAAACEALNSAGLLDLSQGKQNPLLIKDNHIDPKRIGLMIGTAAGGASILFDVSKRILEGKRVTSFDMLQFLFCRSNTIISNHFKINGGANTTSNACATGSISLTEAYDALTKRHPDFDIVIAGGTDSAFSALFFEMFIKMGALSQEKDNPQRASRPFSPNPSGFVMSEGSGILVLETEEHALGRNAKILAELIGYGNTSDGLYDVAPSYEGEIEAMRKALKMANLKPEEIDYINAHGTSTELGDLTERNAIIDVFGSDVYNPRLPVSSTKGSTGHMMGAAGAVEAEIIIMAILKGIIPPTLNLSQPFQEKGIYFPNMAEHKPVINVMSNSFGFGGKNSVTIFRRYK